MYKVILKKSYYEYPMAFKTAEEMASFLEIFFTHVIDDEDVYTAEVHYIRD